MRLARASVLACDAAAAAAHTCRVATLDTFHVIEKVDEDTLVCHNLHKRMWPAAQREGIFLTHIRQVGRGEWSTLFVTIEHDKVPVRHRRARRASFRHSHALPSRTGDTRASRACPTCTAGPRLWAAALKMAGLVHSVASCAVTWSTLRTVTPVAGSRRLLCELWRRASTPRSFAISSQRRRHCVARFPCRVAFDVPNRIVATTVRVHLVPCATA